MSVQLLDNTRRLNHLLRKPNTGKFVFDDICKVIGEVLHSNVSIFSRKGKLLGAANELPAELRLLELPEINGMYLDESLNGRFLNILSTKENVNLLTLGLETDGKIIRAMASPIEIGGKRLGTLFVYRPDEEYSVDDIVLCEYGTTVLGLEIVRSDAEHSAEEIRQQQIVRSAMGSLTVSEREAVYHVMTEMEGTEGILVASKVADKVGLTRSVIVNALRKLESAGVIESKSSGMRGTYLKVVNPYLLDAIIGQE